MSNIQTRYIQSYEETIDNDWVLKTPTVKNPCSLLLLASCVIERPLSDFFPFHVWRAINKKICKELYSGGYVVKYVNECPQYNLFEYNPKKRRYREYQHVPAENLGTDKWLRVRRKLSFDD